MMQKAEEVKAMEEISPYLTQVEGEDSQRRKLEKAALYQKLDGLKTELKTVYGRLDAANAKLKELGADAC